MSLNSNLTLPNIIKKGALATFNKEYRRYAPIYTEFTDIVQSTTAVENHTGIGSTPPITKFSDELKPGVVYDYGYSLENNEWTAALKVSKSVIEDQQMGQLTRKINQMARKAARFLDLHMAQVLEAGENNNGIEGQRFFSTTHRAGGNRNDQSNLFTGSALNKNNLNKLISAVRKFQDDQSEVINVVPTKIVVPPELENQAKTLLNALIIDNTTNVLSQSNMRVIVDPYLTEEDSWYVIGDENPLIYQNRLDVEFVSISPDTSGNTALHWLFYTRMRGQGGYGDWRYIAKAKA